MANEASIVIPVEMDDKQAQAALAKLNRDMQRTQKAISESETSHNSIAEQLRTAQQEAIATYNRVEELKTALAENDAVLNFNMTGKDVNAEEYAQALEKHNAISAELKKQETLLEKQESTAQKLETQDQKVLDKLQEQTAELASQKEQAGNIEKQFVSAGSDGLSSMKASIEGATMAAKKGARILLKYGLSIRSMFALIRRLRSAVVEGVQEFAQQDRETRDSINGLKASLATLKAGWGAAFAPILNAVAPLLNKLIGWLTSAANAITRFFNLLGGRSTYKKAVSNQESLAKSISGTGGAAEKAQKQLAGFDEITQLTAQDSGGGGGSGGHGSGYDYIDEDIDTTTFGARLTTKIKDVLFDWSDLTPEQIAEKCFAAVPTLVGMVAGGMIGGVPGVLIGGLVGLTLGIFGDNILFNGDGELSREEILNMLQTALSTLGFAAIGLVVGGPFGMALGATVGLGLSLAMKVGFAGENPVAKFCRENLSDQAIIGFIKKNLSWEKVKTFFWDDGLKWVIDEILSLFGTSWDTFGVDIATKWEELTTWFHDKWDALQSWWQGLSLGAFDFKTPHLQVTWQPLEANSILSKLLGISSLPHLSVAWYARGGIVDGATLIGAGEAGKEAIIPLERNTEWISKVASELASMLFDGKVLDRIAEKVAEIPSALDRYAVAISNIPLPAMATGSIVPPQVIAGGFDSEWSDGINRRLDTLSALVEALLTRDNDQTTKLYLDGKEIAEAVTRRQRNAERAGIR